jgi:hypothetical protein
MQQVLHFPKIFYLASIYGPVAGGAIVDSMSNVYPFQCLYYRL